MRHFDLSPLYRNTIGFDQFASLFDELSGFDTDAPKYPPYNIERLDENEYRITMAVAGFSEDELTIEVKESMLTVKGEKTSEVEEKDTNYLHRGIATRNFERRFQLADHVQVNGAGLENGLLHVDLVRELPEAMKPRTIAITKGNGSEAKVIENNAA